MVDFKLTSGEPGRNHRVQLAGYSLLAEAAFGLPARRAFLYRIPDNRIFAEPVTEELRQAVKTAVVDIRRTGDRSFALSRPRSVGAAWSASLQTTVRTCGKRKPRGLAGILSRKPIRDELREMGLS